MPCRHAGPHDLRWNLTVANTDMQVADAVRIALVHADADESDVGLVERVLDRGASKVDDEELAVIRRVLDDAAEYMAVNRYAADLSFPEDALAASIICPGGASVCWTDAMAAS